MCRRPIGLKSACHVVLSRRVMNLSRQHDSAVCAFVLPVFERGLGCRKSARASDVSRARHTKWCFRVVKTLNPVMFCDTSVIYHASMFCYDVILMNIHRVLIQ